MRANRRLALPLILITAAISPASAEIDKSKPMLCALGEAYECVRGKSCDRVQPGDLGAPRFFSIDLTQKMVQGMGPGARERKSLIGTIGEAGPLLVMQGMDAQRENRGALGWSASVSEADGGLVLTASSEDGAFVVFGDCIVKE